MDARRPLRRSAAVTERTPFSSTRNSTSICGMPAGIGGIPRRSNRAIDRQSATSSRSPCRTWKPTFTWPSTEVENISVARVGMLEFRMTSLATAPPTVSMPRESGTTSTRRRSRRAPASTDAWTAAPSATTWSGSSAAYGSMPKNAPTAARTAGIRVLPPTRTTRSISGLPASRMARRQAAMVRSISGAASCSRSARVSVRR